MCKTCYHLSIDLVLQSQNSGIAGCAQPMIHISFCPILTMFSGECTLAGQIVWPKVGCMPVHADLQRSDAVASRDL